MPRLRLPFAPFDYAHTRLLPLFAFTPLLPVVSPAITRSFCTTLRDSLRPLRLRSTAQFTLRFRLRFCLLRLPFRYTRYGVLLPVTFYSVGFSLRYTHLRYGLHVGLILRTVVTWVTDVCTVPVVTLFHTVRFDFTRLR